MRMWMVNPTYMCRKHLIGEHYELHMIEGCLKKGKNLKGFIDKNLIFPNNIRYRHSVLVEEMKKRGYKHNSPLDKKINPRQLEPFPMIFVLTEDGKTYDKFELDLFERCKECAMLHKLAQTNDNI